MDNLSSHLTTNVIDAAIENDVTLLFLPAHSSHLLQSLDVGYFHVLTKTFAVSCQWSGLCVKANRA